MFKYFADDPNLDIGNAVYVFAGSNITPDDIDGVDPDPVAVIPVEPNSIGDYVYHTVIAPGTRAKTSSLWRR